MPLLPIFFDTVSKELSFALQGPTGFKLPILNTGDRVSFLFSAIQRVSQRQSPLFAVVSLAGFALTIAIGPTGSQLASQNVFTPNSDNTSLTGVLDLNTAGINALTDLQSGIYLEICLQSATELYKATFDVRIKKSVIVAGVLVDPAGDTALGALVAQRVYVQKEGPAGDAIISTSKDGLAKRIWYVRNDGSRADEPYIPPIV